MNVEVYKEIQAMESAKLSSVACSRSLSDCSLAWRRTLAQRNAQVAALHSAVSTLTSAIQAKQDRQKEVLQTLATHEERRARLRKQQNSKR